MSVSCKFADYKISCEHTNILPHIIKKKNMHRKWHCIQNASQNPNLSTLWQREKKEKKKQMKERGKTDTRMTAPRTMNA